MTAANDVRISDNHPPRLGKFLSFRLGRFVNPLGAPPAVQAGLKIGGLQGSDSGATRHPPLKHLRLKIRLPIRISSELVNIGYGAELKIRDFAETICRVVDFVPALSGYATSRYVGARSKCLDVAKFRRHMPASSPRTLSAGLSPMIDWVRTHLFQPAA